MKNIKRLFIAINLPEEIKKKISQIVAELSRDAHKYFKSDEIRFLSPENWHLTISFLGWQSDEMMDKITSSIKEICRDFASPEIGFKNVLFAPPKKPRMIWLSGREQTSKSLGQLKDDIEDLLIENGVRFKIENRKYDAHITLARFSENMATEEFNEYLLKFNKKFNQSAGRLNFKAESLDLMESHIDRSGAEYIVLSKISFQEFQF